ncbi:MAG: hypothetical protein ISS80_04135 [Candidatus Cloacimonetes bacterium]|nr:hypothetical protein [Candidatus Cloacimonadota bacterium]
MFFDHLKNLSHPKAIKTPKAAKPTPVVVNRTGSILLCPMKACPTKLKARPINVYFKA